MSTSELSGWKTRNAGRFGFGRNWKRFSRVIDEQRVAEARESIAAMLGRSDLSGLSFLDVGSGSGLFSLAAQRSGASVHSFDFDPESVECTRALRERFGRDDPSWRVEQASVLDNEYMEALGRFDIVYAWGVLHHTGHLWQALDNAAGRVAGGGLLYIALYNDQGWLSRYWLRIKRLYNTGPLLRAALIGMHAPYFVGLRWLVRRLRGGAFAGRGMSLWYDMKDWLGGYPFETARPGEVLAFLRPRGFELVAMTTCGGRHGCNEYLFARPPAGRGSG